MITAARRRVLLADAEKFSMVGTVRVCDANELDVLVTDADDSEPALAGLTVQVVHA
jgi:DeoR/GlpR family transcriptional regulator of sugar metabolism